MLIPSSAVIPPFGRMSTQNGASLALTCFCSTSVKTLIAFGGGTGIDTGVGATGAVATAAALFPISSAAMKFLQIGQVGTYVSVCLLSGMSASTDFMST